MPAQLAVREDLEAEILLPPQHPQYLLILLFAKDFGWSIQIAAEVQQLLGP